MNQSAKILPLTFGALAALATTTVAQGPPGTIPPTPVGSCLPYWPQKVIDWTALPTTPPGAYGEGTNFGRLIVGDWDRDFREDLAVIAGSRACIVKRPMDYADVIPIENALNGPLTNPIDIVAVAGVGFDGGHALLATSAAGLEQYVFVPSTNEFQVTLIDTGPWTVASQLHSDDLNNDGRPDVYGISGNSVLYTLNLASGFGPTLSLPLPVTPSDVLALDWEGFGGIEFAILSDVGLQVRTMSNSVIVTHLFAGTYPGAIARITLPDPVPGQYVVWARDETGSPPELVIVRDSVTIMVGDLNFDLCQGAMNVKPTSLHVGNWDNSGLPDLMIDQPKNKAAIVLKNTGQSPYFEPSNPLGYEVFPLENAFGGSLNAGIPAFAQIDGQGSDDVIFPLRDTEEIKIFTELPLFVNPNAFAQLYSGMIAQPDGEFTPDTSGPNPVSKFRFAFKVPDQYLNSKNYIEIVVWEELINATSTGPGGPSYIPDTARLYPLAQTPEGAARRYQYVELDLPVAQGNYWDPQRWYWTEYRFANWDGNTSQVVEMSPTFFGGMTLDTFYSPTAPFPLASNNNSTFYDHLWANGNQGLAYPLTLDEGVSQAESNNGDYFGAYVPCSDEAPHANGAPPDPNSQPVEQLAIWYLPGL